jgi:hypothetical protein
MVSFVTLFKVKKFDNSMVTKKGFKQLTINIPEELWKELSHKTIEVNKTKADIVINLLKEYLKRK